MKVERSKRCRDGRAWSLLCVQTTGAHPRSSQKASRYLNRVGEYSTGVQQIQYHTHTTHTMSLPLRPSLLPQCTSCLRRLANAGLQEWRPAQQQVRGKKKLANKNMPSTISVRLLKPVKTFGRRGKTCPLPTHTPINLSRDGRTGTKSRGIGSESNAKRASFQAQSSPSPSAKCAMNGSLVVLPNT